MQQWCESINYKLYTDWNNLCVFLEHFRWLVFAYSQFGSIISRIVVQGVSRTATWSGKEVFVEKVYEFQPLNSAEEISILDFAVVLDTPLVCYVCFFFLITSIFNNFARNSRPFLWECAILLS